MSDKFTPEALDKWDLLTDAEKKSWTEPVCPMCKATFDRDDFSGSIHEDQLALFHQCESCGEKEVRLIEDSSRQKAIDDDFERWKAAKEKQHPELFGK